MKQSSTVNRPSIKEIDAEIARLGKTRKRTITMLWAAGALIVVVAMAVLAAVLWFPVLQVMGNSMTPTLQEGDLVLSVKGQDNVHRGDVIAFYFEEKVLVKRVIGVAGDEIIIDEIGNVYVNGQYLDEPYLETKSADRSNMEYPLIVEEASFFVLGDNRAISADSRSEDLGFIERQSVISKLIVRAWPLSDIGLID